jgi:hypothetical protein
MMNSRRLMILLGWGLVIVGLYAGTADRKTLQITAKRRDARFASELRDRNNE